MTVSCYTWLKAREYWDVNCAIMMCQALKELNCLWQAL